MFPGGGKIVFFVHVVFKLAYFQHLTSCLSFFLLTGTIKFNGQEDPKFTDTINRINYGNGSLKISAIYIFGSY